MDFQTGSIPASSRILVPRSKFGAPASSSRSIVRDRLLRPLHADGWRVALLTAGPATGKTTLTADWFHSLGRTAREWLRLDVDDNQPERFWMSFTTALERSLPGAFAGSVQRASNFDRAQFELLDSVLSDWADAAEPLTLVVDDAHHLRDHQLTKDLGALMEHLPRGSRVVLISRLDLPLPIAAWRVRSWLVEIRQHELAFTLPEAQSLFETLGEVDLEPRDVETIWRQSEGWVAALRLASSTLRGRTDLAVAVSEFSGRNPMVADLLAEQLLSRQAPDIADFLLRTSILDTLDAELCDALSGRDDSYRILLRMASELQFVTTIGPEREAFRYHPLFAELLRFELARLKPSEVRPLHQLAAVILEKRGEFAGAVRHLLSADEADRAFSLVFLAAYWQHDKGDIPAVEAMVGLFPRHLVELSTFRMLTYALMLGLCGKPAEGVPWLERAAIRLVDEPDSANRDRATLDAIRLLTYAVTGEQGDQIEAGRRAVEAVEAGFDLGVVGGQTRVNLARAHLIADELEDAERVIASGRPGDELAQLLFVPALSARVALRRGELREAERQAGVALRAAGALNVDPAHYGVMDARLAVVGVLIDRDELQPASAELEVLHSLMSRKSHSRPYRVLVDLTTVRLATAQRDLESAFRVLREAGKFMETGPASSLHLLLRAAEARVHLAAGDPFRAEHLIPMLRVGSPSHTLLSARLELGTDRPAMAQARAQSGRFTCPRDTIEASLLMAKAAVALGGDAREELRRATALAAPDGLVRIFLDEGRTISRAARVEAELQKTDGGDALAMALGRTATTVTDFSRSPLPLTSREIQVLRFLPSHLNYSEIAAECFVSVNTVKTHIKGIYMKLNASSRSEAIARARSLGLPGV